LIERNEHTARPYRFSRLAGGWL